MKYFLLIALFGGTLPFYAQTVFWSETFDSPAGGANNNNGGIGWSAGANTPGGGPNGSLLGTTNNWTISNADGCVSGNKLYIRAFGLFGSNTNSYLSDVTTDKYIFTPDISTVGASNISLSFTWRCNGVANLDYGQVGFSNDAGATFTWDPFRYQSQSSCTQRTIPVPSLYENISNFRIAYRFISSATSCSTCEPPFNIDNIELTASFSGCAAPVASAGSNQSICPLASVLIGGSPTASGGSGGPYSYSWSPSAGLNNTTIANPTANPVTTTIYTVTVTDISTSCTATSSVTVTVNTLQALTTTPSGNQAICQGASLALNAANGFTNYVWTTPSGTQNGQSITATQAGNYSVTAIGSNGCSSTSALVVLTVNTPQALTTTPAGNIALCEGESVSISAASGFSNYQWQTPSGQQNGATIQAGMAGNYIAQATDANGCISTATAVVVTIETIANIPVSPSGNVIVCEGQSLTLTASSGFTNYAWNGLSGSNTLEITQSGTYSVSGISSSGCNAVSNAVEVNFVAAANLFITQGNSAAVCSGESISLSVNQGFSNYVWTTPSGNLEGAQIQATAAGNYVVNAIDANTCSSSSQEFTLSVNAPQVLTTTPSGAQSICPEGNLFLNAANGFTNYVWTSPAGLQNTQGILATEAGNYSVSANDANGCESVSAEILINIQDIIDLEILVSGPTVFCEGDQVTLSIEGEFTSIEWNGLLGGNSLIVTESGSYQANAISQGGCLATSEPLEIEVLPAASAISINTQGNAVICGGGSIELSASEGFELYSWNNGNSEATIQINEAGVYQVTGIDENGCESVSEPFNVASEPIQSIALSEVGPQTLCIGSSLTVNAEDGFTNYIWSNGFNGQSLNITQSGIYSVSGQTPAGCNASSGLLNIDFIPAPVPSFTFMQTSEYNVDFTSTSQHAQSYLWIFPGEFTSTLENPSFDFPFDNTWPVILTVINDCATVTDTFNIDVIKTNVNHVNLPHFELYPNPATTELFVRLDNKAIYTLRIFDTQGRLLTMYKEHALEKEIRLDITPFSEGAYILEIESSERIQHMRWIKQN